MHVELPVAAFIAAFLVVVPFPWHWRARNIPTLTIIAWLCFSNLAAAINSIIWAGNVTVVAPVWCDIVSKSQIGATMALPACCLCLCIHLERIASVRNVGVNLREKRLRMIFDLIMCWAVPVIVMALHYIVQGHRFDIVEDLGCRPTVYQSVPAIFIFWLPPILAVFLTLVFATLALVHFFRRRVTFAKHLAASNSALTTSRYFRLMAMVIVQMFWSVLVISLNLWFTFRDGLHPWTGWADVHYNFSRIGLFPNILMPISIQRWTYFLWWQVPISSVIFFAFFGFGEEAVKEYKSFFGWLRKQFSSRISSSVKRGPGDMRLSRIRIDLEQKSHCDSPIKVEMQRNRTSIDKAIEIESLSVVTVSDSTPSSPCASSINRHVPPHSMV